ncbi:hypothetical protein BJ742DRAFT_738377 [Cladochytrium replicatum]|nr:hypothetical protein BJ742DRAFT_738377 [Cladochytrium replicatum]
MQSSSSEKICHWLIVAEKIQNIPAISFYPEPVALLAAIILGGGCQQVIIRADNRAVVTKAQAVQLHHTRKIEGVKGTQESLATSVQMRVLKRGECPVEAKEWFDAKLVWVAGLYGNQESEAGGWEEWTKVLVEGGQEAIRVCKGSCRVTPDDPEQGIVGNSYVEA